MNGERIPGLRIFLYTVIDLIVQGESETCKDVETQLSNGVASELRALHPFAFDENELDPNNISEIDEYFKKWRGVADGEEMRKYGCREDDGLALIVKLALNEIF